MDMGRRCLMDAGQISGAIEQIASGILAEVEDGKGLPPCSLALVGIRTRGEPLARRIAGRVGELCGETPPVGVLDITLYRDDIATCRGAFASGVQQPLLRSTQIPFAVDGLVLVLVDDVLFTGRTVRAALDAIVDLGRPTAIRLAVLVDRGHRELPISADYVGARVETTKHESVEVALSEVDASDAAFVCGVCE